MNKKTFFSVLASIMFFIPSGQFSNLSAMDVRTVPSNTSECSKECLEAAYPYAVLSRDVYNDTDSFEWNGWIRGGEY